MRLLILAVLAALSLSAHAGAVSASGAEYPGTWDSACSMIWCDPWWVDLPDDIKEKFDR